MEYRVEHDLLGDKNVPADAYYGIQTLRAIENFNISGVKANMFPLYIKALAAVKMAAAKANYNLGLLPKNIKEGIVAACEEIMDGQHNDEFPIDLIQGGAGTSTNMNINEVVANRALEIMGHQKGEYEYCHPNNHVNMAQSTNDAFPTSINIALSWMNEELVKELKCMVASFRQKGEEFKHIIKMGRTQLQDAVPMTLGQEFEAFAATLEEEIDRLNTNANLFHEINMGATAIGTGINADPEYPAKVTKHLRDITGLALVKASNFIEATPDTGAFVIYSGTIKRLGVKLSKICNDLRLLSSGPRTGLNEINLPPMQPGSSIMPGKVNPVIPEVVNQICFIVFGNDLTITFAAEAGQLQLNVMEPVIVRSLFENIQMLRRGMKSLRVNCVDDITANEDHCRDMVLNSIGIVTALNPILGYEISSALAKEALATNGSIYQMVLDKELIPKDELDRILSPENMVTPHKLDRIGKENNDK
ncbi:aspartate ammonia-lyase [Persicobacter diffluens]